MVVRPKRNYDITALQRGLRLLHLFSNSPGGLTAKQVAASSRLPVSTVHRFLANLVTAGFLNRDGEGTHHLGIACFSIGQAAVGQLDIRRLSLPYLQELKTELYRVRKNGYAFDLEEHELHIRCVAAPIWDHTGSVQSSLSLTAPTFRMPVTRLRQLAPLIQAAGQKISAELGYQSAASPISSTARNGDGKTDGRLGKMAV